MVENKGNLVLGIIFLMVIISAGMFLSIYFEINPFSGSDEPAEPKKLDMVIECPAGSKYVLYYKDIRMFDGTVWDYSVEKVRGIFTTRDYDLYCWDEDKYYISSKVCSNQTKCGMELDKLGDIETDYDVYSNDIEYTVNVSDGYFRDGLLCLSWQGIYNVHSMEYNETKIPQRLESYVDKCYSIGTWNNEEMMIKIIYDEIDSSDSFLEFMLIDKCNDGIEQGYFDCGIKDHIDKVDI